MFTLTQCAGISKHAIIMIELSQNSTSLRIRNSNLIRLAPPFRRVPQLVARGSKEHNKNSSMSHVEWMASVRGSVLAYSVLAYSILRIAYCNIRSALPYTYRTIPTGSHTRNTQEFGPSGWVDEVIWLPQARPAVNGRTSCLSYISRLSRPFTAGRALRCCFFRLAYLP